MNMLPETLEMFIRLENLYAEREYGIGYATRSRTQHDITRLEFDLEEHCSKIYDLPWFRLFTLWKVNPSYVDQVP